MGKAGNSSGLMVGDGVVAGGRRRSAGKIVTSLEISFSLVDCLVGYRNNCYDGVVRKERNIKRKIFYSFVNRSYTYCPESIFIINFIIMYNFIYIREKKQLILRSIRRYSRDA